MSAAPPPGVLDAWSICPDPADLVAVALASGLINATWRLDGPDGPVGVLQRLNGRVFRPEVHVDIEAVTTHLSACGVPTPRLVRTRAGHLWHTHDGAAWRVLTHVGDRTVEVLSDPSDARSAGRLIGRLHHALATLDHTFVHVRPGAHDTDAHLATMQTAVDAHGDHRLHDAVAPLVETLTRAWERLKPELPALPPRVIHGDLKVSNVRFLGDEAHAVIDLDTFAVDTLGAELGDAMRSWCGSREDQADATFDLGLLEAAMQGYAETTGGGFPTSAEWEAIVPSTQRITTELAMRFAADALNESYFGWDAARFPASGEQQLAKARSQANLAEAVAAARPQADRIVRIARGG